MLPTLIHPDTIVYHDIVPDTTFNATGPPLCCNPYSFICRDSTCSYQLDVDADGIMDFEFVSQVQYVSGGTPTSSTSEAYYGSVNCVNNYDSVISISINGPVGIKSVVSAGNVISNSLNYINASSIYYTYPRLGSLGINYTNDYIGFKIVRHNKNYFGWILFSNIANSMTIKSWAINKTANNSIIAGQTH